MDEVRYQVFVSSTFTDLKEEREKVLQAILQSKAFPAGMELFPAADEDQFEFIKREIDSSDYYIVIIAGRYGSIAEDGLSFTEKEYDYARAAAKPILAFLAKDLGKLIGDKLEHSETQKSKLDAFREKAKKSKLVRFYSNPDELKAEVLHSLSSQFNLKPMRGWVRADQTPRAALETITKLQERVIELDSENQKLRAAENDIANQLASGAASVRWTVDLEDVKIGNERGPQAAFYVESTWDGLLARIFSGEKSDVDSKDVKRSIWGLIIQSMPQVGADPVWFRGLTELFQQKNYLPASLGADRIVADVQRQFSGLGLIQEGAETRYTNDPLNGTVSPRSARIWKLTAKGSTRLALIEGYRRSDQTT